MPFWKRKKNKNEIVLCPSCEWNPDGKAHWSCSCGYKWNTFSSKGKCPKCSTQWEDTSCPACRKSFPHQDWYWTKEKLEQLEQNDKTGLRNKKKRLESKLISYGITKSRVSYLPYLDHSNEVFKAPIEVGARMMILYSLAVLARQPEDKGQVEMWLKEQEIWKHTSESEREFFETDKPKEKTLAGFSWRIESALTLAWCLGKVNKLPRLDEESDKAIDGFGDAVPEIGEPLGEFLSNLKLRPLGAIYEENLLNELATTYFRNLIFNGDDDETRIDRQISFERHQVLNWTRNFMEFEGWDEVDTST